MVALKNSKRDLNKIMDSSVDIICAVDEAGKFIRISAAAIKIWGYTPAQLIGKPYIQFVYWEDHQKTTEGAARVIAGTNMTNFENRYVHKNGLLVPMLWSARWDNRKKIMYCVARDATEKLQSEATLIASEKKYMALFELNPLPSFMWDAETLKIIDCNEEAVVKYGYTKEEFSQLSVKDLRPADDVPFFEQPIKPAEENDQNDKRVWRHKKKNGELMFVNASRRLIKQDKIKSSWLVVVNDITEKIKAEEQKELEKRDKEALINSTDDAMWSVNINFELIAANKTFIGNLEVLTGIRFEPGDNVLKNSVFPENYISFWKEYYAKCLSGESFKKEISLPASKNSKEQWWDIKFTPIYKERAVFGVACYARDITENKIAEQAIIFRAELLNTIGQAVIATNLDGTRPGGPRPGGRRCRPGRRRRRPADTRSRLVRRRPVRRRPGRRRAGRRTGTGLEAAGIQPTRIQL